MNGQHRLKGVSITSTHGGVVKRFTIPRDLPTEETANLSVVFSTTGFLLASHICCHIPNARLFPVRFLPTNGGTLEFAGIDRLTYASLPTDGLNALYRDGTVSEATIPSYQECHSGGCEPRYNIDHGTVYAVEYYNAARDHYFITASAPDIDALDSGRLKGWARTGSALWVSGRSNMLPESRPMCRFYLPPGHGDSHFFSASEEECEAVRSRFPAFNARDQRGFPRDRFPIPQPDCALPIPAAATTTYPCIDCGTNGPTATTATRRRPRIGTG